MLRIDPLRVEHPASVDEAIALLAAHPGKAKLCAGGTDLVPNLKHGLHEPALIVHLGRISTLRGIEETDAGLTLGALTTLHEVANDARVATLAPGLAEAAAAVAGPQLRRMGTLGGNLCLDTRCSFYNQTYFWREALGFCLKKDGTACHVVAGGTRCVAAASNDTATMLLCLDARVCVQRTAGVRTLPLDELYVPNGVKNTVLDDDEVLVRVHVPRVRSDARRLEGYAKLRHRNSIDFPLLSVGVRFDVDAASNLVEARLTVSALGARPHRVPLDAFLGQPLTDATVDAMGKLAHKRCVPLMNIADDPAWRRDMIPVLVERAARSARSRHVA
jgi:4-hydroxybenzoyl-CoA reductase subunit beta